MINYNYEGKFSYTCFQGYFFLPSRPTIAWSLYFLSPMSLRPPRLVVLPLSLCLCLSLVGASQFQPLWSTYSVTLTLLVQPFSSLSSLLCFQFWLNVLLLSSDNASCYLPLPLTTFVTFFPAHKMTGSWWQRREYTVRVTCQSKRVLTWTFLGLSFSVENIWNTGINCGFMPPVYATCENVRSYINRLFWAVLHLKYWGWDY